MPPRQLGPLLLSWASSLDPATVEQAARIPALPFVAGQSARSAEATTVSTTCGVSQCEHNVLRSLSYEPVVQLNAG
jgi:hypothetical protein